MYLYVLSRHVIGLDVRVLNAMSDQILTVKEVAEYLKVNERTVYRLAIEKKVPAFRVGSSWRFRKGQIDGWIKAQEEKLDPESQ